MKTKAILATLLVAVAASADARFAWPYPPKAVSPDEIGHWVVINGNAWADSSESELTTASLFGGEADGLQTHVCHFPLTDEVLGFIEKVCLLEKGSQGFYRRRP